MVSRVLPRGLIVSCQALENEPLHSPFIMAKMAKAAAEGGAIAIRANTKADIEAIKKEVNLPIIGLVKSNYKDSPVYITPTIKEVEQVFLGGAEIVAFDGTLQDRPEGTKLDYFISQIKREFPSLYLMADIATFEEAKIVDSLGVDLISTTLSGYTVHTKGTRLPNLPLVERMVKELHTPIIAEGGISNPSQVREAFSLGAYGVVVGSAITRPREITKSFCLEVPHA